MASARAWLPALAFCLSGCSSLAYYAQAVDGHVRIMHAARPIAEVIDDAATDPALKKTLAEVRRARDFASRDLGLPDNDSYHSYADLQRPFAVWNVFAAPEFSLQPHCWCMLVVGCVGYRGYYDRQDAEALAGELRDAGFDTHVGGVPAYSTLGRFSDPLLNTFLRDGSLEAARLIFHELAHQVVYVEGDTVFNESFATAVENEGLRRWSAHGATPDQMRALSARQRWKADFLALLGGYRARLQEVYASTLPDGAKRAAKAEILAELQRSYLAQQSARGEPPVYRQWIGDGLNNAKLASVALYAHYLPAFEAILAEVAHDLPSFYRRVALLAALPPAERHAALDRRQPGPLPAASLAVCAGK